MRTMTSTTTFVTVSTAQTPIPTPAIQRSPWHSPVPYLFGGLAAMLGLIAFALLILACSYWRLTGREEDRRRDLESSGESNKDDSDGKASKLYEQKILVIMAGDENPTCLATPVCAKLVSFDDGKEMSDGAETNAEKDSSDEKGKKEVTDIAVEHDHDDESSVAQDQEQQNQ